MKTSKTYGKGKLVMFLFVLLMACEKEPQIEIAQEEQPQIDMGYLSIEQLPELEHALSDVLSEKASKFISGKTLKYKKARIDVGNILKVKSQKNSINYTMHVFVEGAPENEFYNLITHKTASGKFKKPYILRYVVDEDAMDIFVANNYNFSYFRGVRYTYKFDKFFKDYEIGNKSNADPCDEGTAITNISQTGYGGIRDIPVTNNLQTNAALYDFSQSNTSQSFFLYYNSYDDNTKNDTSFGSSVYSNLIEVSTNDNPGNIIQIPPLVANLSGAITLVRATWSKQWSASFGFDSITSNCIIVLTREYSDGTIFIIDYNCWETPQKPSFSSKSPDDDCPEVEGETGVLITSAMVAEIVDAYGLSVLTKPRLTYLNSSTSTTDIYNYLSINNFSEESMEIGLKVIDALISGVPVIFDPLKDVIYSGEPLDYMKLNDNQRVKAIVDAIKYAHSKNEIQSFDIRKIFTNIPQYKPAFDIVAKIIINGKLLTIRTNFMNMDNLEINKYANEIQYYYVSGIVNKVDVTGYWTVLKYRTYQPSQNYSAEALFLSIKESALNSTVNYEILYDYFTKK